MGIQAHRDLKESWVFKGGTCLKKCYFENYRFSEDLEFTLMHFNDESREKLHGQLVDICDWIYENSGIEIPHDSITLETYQNLQKAISIQGKLTYRGPLQRKTNFPRIKLDLTVHEKIVRPPETRTLYHAYSDAPNSGLQVTCYGYEEIFAEKLRALAERARPRDLYDVVHLYEAKERIRDKKALLISLQQKCAFKKIPSPRLETIQKHPQKAILTSEWNNMLAHQLSALKPFEYFWNKIPEVFEWLYDSKDI